MWDLLVLGCGPVGALAGNLAGQAGLATVVVDRAPRVFDLPRAIHFDAHIMRILQDVGLAAAVLEHLRVWRRSTFYGADGQPIRVHDWPAERTFGWDAHYLFYQPTLEGVLRSGLDRFPGVDLRLGVEALELTQYDDHVEVVVRDVATGRVERLAARYVLGADGATSFARTSSGITLTDGGFDEPWLVVDLRCQNEIGLPNESEMFCDPARPSTRVPGPGDHHRWEFMLLPGETPQQAARPEFLRALLAPWVRPEEVQLIRASVYRFHSLVARPWRRDRVFLAGDAAHQTPPFLGQGMCHGMRDVHNLVTKLAAVQAGGPADLLLDSYEAERRPHVERIIDMAVAAGREICLLDPLAARERDDRMRRAAARNELPQTTFQGMPPLSGGLFPDTPGAGELFPQPRVRACGRPAALLDDAVGPGVLLVSRGLAPLPEVAALGRRCSVPVAVVGAGPAAREGVFLVEDGVADPWFDRVGVRCAVLRPDRYVAATACTLAEAEALIGQVQALFPVAAPRDQVRRTATA